VAFRYISFLLLSGAVLAAGSSASASDVVTGDQALQRLVQGNRRYVAHKPAHPDQSVVRLQELEGGQHPFAVVLGCADSRVPPEIVFDQGLGDIFVIRVAGNVLDDEVLGSIEYAVEHLNSPLLVVLGHEKCGAVQAAVQGGTAPGHITSFVAPIRPAVEQARKLPGDVVSNCVRINVQRVVQQLKASEPILAERVHAGQLKVVGARYDLHSGSVAILGE
jgi:carbonic anhydrase